MAIGQSDGSIVLTVKIDTNGLNKELGKLSKGVGTFGKTAKGAFGTTGAAVGSLAVMVGTALVAAMSVAIKKVAELAAKTIEFSKEASEVASKTEASILRLVDIYGDASNAVGDFIDQNAMALGMSRAAAASYASVYGNLFSVWADQATNAKLTNSYLNMTAVVASKTGRTVEDVQERIRSGLLGNTEAIEDLGIFVNVKTIEMTDAFQRMANGKSWEQLDAYTQQQIRTMAILEQATAKYGNEVAQTSVLAKSRLSAAYDEFKNTWGQAVNIILIPILNTITDIVRVATTGLNTILGFSDKLLGDTTEISDKTEDWKNNQDSVTDSTKDTANAQKKVLAGFDDIQILSQGETKNQSNAQNEIDLPDLETPINNLESVAKEIEKILSPLKQSFSGLFSTLDTEITTFLEGSGGKFSTWFKENLAADVVEKSSTAIDTLSGSLTGLGETLGIVSEDGVIPLINDIVGYVTRIIEYISTIISTFLTEFSLFAPEVVSVLGFIWDTVANIFMFFLDQVIVLAQSVIRIIINIIAIVSYAFQFIVDAVNFVVALLSNDAEEAHRALSNIVRDFFNIVIACLNIVTAAINAVWGTIWSIIVFALDEILSFANRILDVLPGGKNIDTSWIRHDPPLIPSIPPLPRLAEGAVIPANREFLAVLGDQKNGTNIEAPADLIKQMAKEALLEVGAMGQTTKEEHYYLGETELMRVLHKLTKGGQRLEGNSLIQGGSY